MKREAFVFVFVIPFLVLGMTGCGSSGGVPPPAPEVTQLSVIATAPADLAEGVAADLDGLVVYFNEPIDLASLTPTSVVATCPLGDIPGTLMLAAGGTALHLFFDAPIGFLMPVEVTVEALVSSMAGSALGTDYLSEFLTEPSGMIVTPATFFGEVSDTALVTCLLVGDLGTQPATGMVFTTDDPAVATVAPDGTITLQGFGQTIVTVDDGTTQTEIPVAAAEFLGRGSACMATGAQWELTIEGDSEWQLHTWDVLADGLVEDGGYDQYDDIWVISVENLTADLMEDFPEVDLAEASFDAPHAFHDSIALETDLHWDGYQYDGDGAAQLRPIGEACMWQDVVLPAGATALDFEWYQRADLESVFGEEVGLRLTVIDLTGGAPDTIVYENGDNGSFEFDWEYESVGLMDWAGETVRLKFEMWGGGYEDWGGGWFIDNAFLLDEVETDYLVNGEFEDGLTGWVGGTYLIPREVNLEPEETVADLEIKRSIYAPYAEGYWIRYLDTFHNPGEDPVDVTIEFWGELGSDGAGVVYMAHGDRAVLEFDGTGSDGDPALGTLPGQFTTMDAPMLDEAWTFTYDVTIPAGGTISILAFHMFGDNNLPMPNFFLETLAGDILSSVDTQGAASPYLEGVTAAEFATVVNWP